MQTLFWADADTNMKTCMVSIIDDQLVEGAETVVLSLADPTGGAELGDPRVAVLTIVDDEDAEIFSDGFESGDTSAWLFAPNPDPYASFGTSALGPRSGDPPPPPGPALDRAGLKLKDMVTEQVLAGIDRQQTFDAVVCGDDVSTGRPAPYMVTACS